MTAKRNVWNLTGKLGCLCIALVPLALAQPSEAKPVLTILPHGTMATSINDSGVVVGIDTSDRGFVRTPDGVMTWFKAPGEIESQVNPPQINRSGVVTGSYWSPNSEFHGFVRAADGTMTTFDAPNSGQLVGTIPCAINARGTIAGWYTDQSGKTRGFVRAVNGTITPFDVPGAANTYAMAINDKGEIAGYAFFTNDRGFVRSATGEITVFDAPGGPWFTRAFAIDNQGTVAGYYQPKSLGVPSYLRHRDGSITTFDLGEGSYTYVTAMNAKETVVGSGATDLVKKRVTGFVRYRHGRERFIGPGYIYPRGINNSGVVVGYLAGIRGNHGKWRGFIWTP